MVIEEHHCPKCGGELVARKGKNGDFFGCSNYPECKYTTNARPAKMRQDYEVREPRAPGSYGGGK